MKFLRNQVMNTKFSVSFSDLLDQEPDLTYSVTRYTLQELVSGIHLANIYRFNILVYS